jgi:tetratricopeptide (TPR) repeat protein
MALTAPRARALLLALFVLALVPRLAFLLELRGSEYFAYPAVDEAEYRDWALKVARGERLSEGVFYASPVYPYALGAFFRLAGPDLFDARVAQALLGAARAPIVAAAAHAAFGPGAAVGAGLFAAFYRTTLFYDGFLLKECLALLIQDVALLLVVLLLRGDAARAAAGRSRALLLASGVLVGLAALAREYLAPFIAGALALVVARAWRLVADAPSGRSAAQGALVAGALFAAGAALPLLVVAARNQIVAGEFVLLSAQGGQNFYLGNSRGNTTGLVTFPPNVRSTPMTLEQDFRALASHHAGRPLGSAETSAYWFHEAVREMASDPVHAATLLSRKALLALNAFEVPNVYSIRYFSRLSRVLEWDPVRFGLLLPLAALGIMVALRDPARRAAAAAPLVLLAIAYAALVAFYVSDRYRLPATTPLFLFAGVGIEAVARTARRAARREAGSMREIGAMLLLMAAAAAVSRLPVVPRGGRGEAMPPANLANELAKEGRYEQAIARYEEAFAIEPDTDFALFGIATVYATLGRHAEAVEVLKKYVARNPSSARAYYNLGIAYYECGHADSSAMALEAAVRLQPYYSEALFNLGAVRQATGDLARARAAYESAVRANPTLARAWNNLGATLIALGQPSEGREALERALADTTYSEPRMTLGGLCLAEGKFAEAARHFEWVLARERRREALFGLGKALAFQGNDAAARAPLELFLRVAPAGDPNRAEAARILATLR